MSLSVDLGNDDSERDNNEESKRRVVVVFVAKLFYCDRTPVRGLLPVRCRAYVGVPVLPYCFVPCREGVLVLSYGCAARLERHAFSCLLSPLDCGQGVNLGPFRPLLGVRAFVVVLSSSSAAALLWVVVGGIFRPCARLPLAWSPNGDDVEHIVRHYPP